MKLRYVKSSGLVKLSPKEARVVGRELTAIQRSVSVITPKAVVDVARNPHSPLHKYFEWNNGKAAEKYREWQARSLICNVQIIDADSDNPQPIRAFVNVSPEDGGEEFTAERGYVAVQSIAGKQNYQNQVLQYAKNQLLSWRRKFGNFKEFFGVSEAIDALK